VGPAAGLHRRPSWGRARRTPSSRSRSGPFGYAAGKVGGSVRVAPSFNPIPRNSFENQKNPLIYTAETVSKETGIKFWKVEAALNRLTSTERGMMPAGATAGMRASAADFARLQIERVERKTKSKAAVKRVVHAIREEHKKQKATGEMLGAIENGERRRPGAYAAARRPSTSRRNRSIWFHPAPVGATIANGGQTARAITDSTSQASGIGSRSSARRCPR
jgi:hypothetical protein